MGRESNLTDMCWQDELRDFYSDPDKAIGIFGAQVDLFANAVALYPIHASIRDMGGQFCRSTDTALNTVVAQWREADTGMQAPLLREMARARQLGGEHGHLKVRMDGRTRFRVVYPPQIDTESRFVDNTQAGSDGQPAVRVGIRYRANTTRPPRNVDIPGEYEWVDEEDLKRCWDRDVPFTGEAYTHNKRILRWLRRIDQLDKKNFRAIDSRLMINKLLLLESDPNRSGGKEKTVDKFTNDYLQATELSRHDTHGQSWAVAPFIARVNSPSEVQLLDLGGDIMATDLEAIREYVRLIADSSNLPTQAILEGAAAGNRYSDFLLDRQVHKQAFQPEIEAITIDATRLYLRPIVAELQAQDLGGDVQGPLDGVNLDEIRVGWSPMPPSLEGQPDLVFRAWSLGLIGKEEAEFSLGVEGIELPDQIESYEHWQLVAGRISAAEAGAPLLLGQDGNGDQLRTPTTPEPTVEDARTSGWYH